MKYNITCKYTYDNKPCTIKARVEISEESYGSTRYQLIKINSKTVSYLTLYDDYFSIYTEINGKGHELEMTLDEEYNTIGFKQIVIWEGTEDIDDDAIIDVIDKFHVVFTSIGNI